MSKNISDFFLNNFFEYENCSCVCQKETVYSVPGQPPHYNLKLCSVPEQTLRFSYSAQKGLNQSGNAGGVISENILGQLLALPINDIDATTKFFEKYGFLFPISSEEYESIDDNALLEIINRVKATVRLMGTIAGKRDYKNMLILTTYLLFSDPVSIKLTTQDYTTCKHTFKKMLDEYCNMPNLYSNQEVFDSGYISVSDTLCKGYNKVSTDDVIAMSCGDGIYNVSGSTTQHFANLFALYTNFPTEDTNLRTIIDFYYHYQTKVGVFSKIAVDRISYHATPNRDNFTDEMKEALLKIAQLAISEEINYNLKNICPQFDIDTLTPSWKLNTLHEALYFSVFYMKPGIELYKECENPNCKHQKYFLINATVTNKKYCCSACGNAAAQRRSRQRKLENK